MSTLCSPLKLSLRAPAASFLRSKTAGAGNLACYGLGLLRRPAPIELSRELFAADPHIFYLERTIGAGLLAITEPAVWSGDF